MEENYFIELVLLLSKGGREIFSLQGFLIKEGPSNRIQRATDSALTGMASHSSSDCTYQTLSTSRNDSNFSEKATSSVIMFHLRKYI